MKYGVAAGPIPLDLPYANIVQDKCDALELSSPLVYAVGWRESIRGQVNGLWPSAASVVADDGGYGLFQLTDEFMSPWPPPNWQDPGVNTAYAITDFILPAFNEFARRGLVGENLVRMVAAAFNAGSVAAWDAHLAGNADDATTGHNYAADVLTQYLRLVNKQHPI